MPAVSYASEVNDMTYQIITTKCKTQGSKPDKVFGIKAVSKEGCAEIEDISTRVSDIKNLIAILKRESVSPNQLVYIVEDFLTELYGKAY
ncbi:MAG: hypothetical protein GX111_01040 [Clostridiales bacterium]|jgi:hypothetical protein|nr:hypothetical protein [Clostridiales bacterium]